MTTAGKLQALVDGLEDIRQAVEGKGATLPAGSPLSDFPVAVESIEAGGEPWVAPPPTDVSDPSHLFRGWTWLEVAPLLDTSNATNMSYMFSNCSSLVEVPLIDTSSVTNMSYMFRDCSSLVEVPLFDTSKAANMGSMFQGCSSLVEVPLFDTSKATSMGSMLQGCSSLESVPLFDTSNVTNMSYMLQECSSLELVPLFDTSNVTNMSNTFNGCVSLVEVELTDCSKVSSTTNMFGTNIPSTRPSSLERLILPGLTRGGFSLRYTQMDASALNDFFHSLGTASGPQTINIAGSLGAAECDKSIATSKGWTITG